MRKRANRERRPLSFREPRHLPHQAAAFFITERRAAVEIDALNSLPAQHEFHGADHGDGEGAPGRP